MASRAASSGRAEETETARARGQRADDPLGAGQGLLGEPAVRRDHHSDHGRSLLVDVAVPDPDRDAALAQPGRQLGRRWPPSGAARRCSRWPRSGRSSPRAVAGDEEAGQVLGLLQEALRVLAARGRSRAPWARCPGRASARGRSRGWAGSARRGPGRRGRGCRCGSRRRPAVTPMASAPAPTKRLCTSRFSSWTLSRVVSTTSSATARRPAERLALGGDALRDAARVAGQRVAAAGLRVAADERLVGGVEEEDGDVGPLAAQVLDDAGGVGQEALLAGVDHQRRCARPRRRCGRRARAASPGRRWGSCRRSRSRRPPGRAARWSSPTPRRR